MAKAKFVRHWRIFWLPGLSICIGRMDGNPAVWAETKARVYSFDIRKNGE